MMPMALTMVPFYSLHQDDCNEGQHDLFCHVTPLAMVLVSHDADGIVNGIIEFLIIRQSKQCAKRHLKM